MSRVKNREKPWLISARQTGPGKVFKIEKIEFI